MACYQTRTLVNLATREAITLPDVRGATLHLRRGTLWLTQEGRLNDTVLRGGDTFVVEFDGDTVVEAQQDSAFTIVGPRGRTLALPRSSSSLAHVASSLSRLARSLAASMPPRQVPYM
jgi:hypothetical protein